MIWPINTKLGVWVANIKAQLCIATQMYVIKFKVTVTKIEIQSPLNNFSLLWPIDTNIGVWVANIKAQLCIAIQLSVIKVKSLLLKRNSVSAQLL